MTDTLTLPAETRDQIGKGAARAFRRAGRLPGIVYGDGRPPQAIHTDHHTVTTIHASGGFLSTPLNLKLAGEDIRVIPRDVQLEPVRDILMHVDFLRLGKDAVIAVEVAVHFDNDEESPGLKRGGVLNVVRHTVELSCPADSIPESLHADLTGLEIGDSIHISHIPLPEGVQPTITDRDFTVATIAAPAVLPDTEEGAPEAEEEAEGDDKTAEKDKDSGGDSGASD